MTMRAAEPAAFLVTAEYLDAKVREALEEDGAGDDVTSAAVVPADLRAEAALTAGGEGVVAGLAVTGAVFRAVDPSIAFAPALADGAAVGSGTLVATVDGRLRKLLAAERVALNFLQQLSGVATLTRRYVEAAGPRAVVLDTRKTVPGLRPLQRLAVRAGGGANHRFNLARAVLVKDNHVAAAGGIAPALRLARGPGLPVEIEVDELAQLREALREGADSVLLDNFSPAQVAEAVRLTAGRAVLEVSGGVTLDTIGAYAATGVDRISVGALTHSAPALDVSMEVTRTWR